MPRSDIDELYLVRPDYIVPVITKDMLEFAKHMVEQKGGHFEP